MVELLHDQLRVKQYKATKQEQTKVEFKLWCVCVCVCGGRGWISNCLYNLNQLQGIGEEDERGMSKRT